MTKKLDANYSRRAVREMVADIDYVGKLSASEKEWLEVFVAATAGNDTEAQATLTTTPGKFAALYNAMADENNARQRDVLNKFSPVPFREHQEGDNDEYSIDVICRTKSEFLKYFKCSRCLKHADRCSCPNRQRHSPYGVEDYTPSETTEDTVIGELDLKRRMQAYDLLPYGDNPTDLMPGAIVQICLPLHLFKGAAGKVLAYRPDDGAYLVQVTSKNGLRDRDGTPHLKPCLWVKATGLRKFKLTIKTN